jgi:hypothetical protein
MTTATMTATIFFAWTFGLGLDLRCRLRGLVSRRSRSGTDIHDGRFRSPPALPLDRLANRPPTNSTTCSAAGSSEPATCAISARPCPSRQACRIVSRMVRPSTKTRIHDVPHPTAEAAEAGPQLVGARAAGHWPITNPGTPVGRRVGQPTRRRRFDSRWARSPPSRNVQAVRRSRRHTRRGRWTPTGTEGRLDMTRHRANPLMLVHPLCSSSSSMPW